MDRPFSIATAGGARPALRVGAHADLRASLATLELAPPRPALVLVGGAGGLDAGGLLRLEPLFGGALVPLAEESGACVLDGGTDAGVMGLMGRARAAARASFPLVGVLVEALAADLDGRGEDSADEPERLEPHHSHFVLVEGSSWGDESPLLAAAAGAVAGGAPTATVLVNGGEVAWADVEHSVRARRPVVAVAGSGRAADDLAAAVAGEPASERATGLARGGLVTTVPAEPAALWAELERILGGEH